MPKALFAENLGKEFGKPDIERLGIFVEMPYMHGKKYVSPFGKPNYPKGQSMLSGGRKLKNGTQHGYFDDEFRRLFIGEGKARRKKQHKPPIPFMAGFTTKKHSTPGDYYGTFSGKIEAFSNKSYRKSSNEFLIPNFSTKNAKKGGPGYVDICLNKYPLHERDIYKEVRPAKKYGVQIGGPLVPVHHPRPFFDKNPYLDTKATQSGPTYVQPKKTNDEYGTFMPVGPAKWPGGSHAGCFDRFPEHKPCKYVSTFDATKPFITDKGDVFYPQSMATKTMFTSSILNQNTDMRVNCTNYKVYEPTFIKYLLS